CICIIFTSEILCNTIHILYILIQSFLYLVRVSFISEKQMILEESYQAKLLPKWLADWLMEIIEREEAVRPTREMSMWIERGWLSSEWDRPHDLKDEKELEAIYND